MKMKHLLMAFYAIRMVPASHLELVGACMFMHPERKLRVLDGVDFIRPVLFLIRTWQFGPSEVLLEPLRLCSMIKACDLSFYQFAA